MKIRQGFVSNSSSSSFIVAFPKGFEPTTKNVIDYVFNGNTGKMTYCDHSADITRVADVIVDYMTSQSPNDHERLMDALGGWLGGAPNYESFKKPSVNGKPYEIDWDTYNVATTRHRDFVFAELLSKWNDL